MVSKALVTGAYQRKAEEIAALGVDLTLFTPPYWQDRRGRQVAETLHTRGYTLRTLPTRRIGDYHLHHYPTLGAELSRLRPDVLHMDEEPYNLATFLALRSAHRQGIASTFFTWQNLNRRYPPPFVWFERANYRRAPIAIAGNREAEAVLRAKGYSGEIALIPQFGIDPDIYHPDNHSPHDQVLRIGYAGALLPEKGIDLLLRAAATLTTPWRIDLIGDGEESPRLQQLAAQLGIAERVHFRGKQPSAAMPAFFADLDVLVLPSRTLPNWKEQFGRVLIEAMASGVVVIGSNSGEIPNVIDNAGLIFPEGDHRALAEALASLHASPKLRTDFAIRGRLRVLTNYTMRIIAERTVALYHRLAAR